MKCAGWRCGSVGSRVDPINLDQSPGPVFTWINTAIDQWPSTSPASSQGQIFMARKPTHAKLTRRSATCPKCASRGSTSSFNAECFLNIHNRFHQKLKCCFFLRWHACEFLYIVWPALITNQSQWRSTRDNMRIDWDYLIKSWYRLLERKNFVCPMYLTSM